MSEIKGNKKIVGKINAKTLRATTTVPDWLQPLIKENGVYVGTEPPTDPEKLVWINPDGQATIYLKDASITDDILNIIKSDGTSLSFAGGSATSPTIDVAEVENGYKLTITDITGTKEVIISNGEPGIQGPQGIQGLPGRDGADGQPGQPGADGQPGKDGKDGFSPTATVESNSDGAVITITDATGTTTAQIYNGSNGLPGQDGLDGQDGFSPTVEVTDTETGVTLTITDVNGAKTATINDGKQGPQGIPGQDGHTPVKGVDYFTESDKQEIINSIPSKDEVYVGPEAPTNNEKIWIDSDADNSGLAGIIGCYTKNEVDEKISAVNVPVATTTTAGKVKPDGTTITVDADGTIHSAGGGGSSYTFTNGLTETDGTVKWDLNENFYKLPTNHTAQKEERGIGSGEAYGTAFLGENSYGNYTSYYQGCVGIGRITAGGRMYFNSVGSVIIGEANQQYGVMETEGMGSIAMGTGTQTTSDFSVVQGRSNIKDTANTYAHIVGNGTSNTSRSNAYTLDWSGNATFAGTVSSAGADYAEFFEWKDGNTEAEDRVGYIVTLDGDKIKLASSDDDILGIVSGTATVLGDNAEWYWNKRWLTDDFGRTIYEDYDVEHEEIISEETGDVIEEAWTEHIHAPKTNPAYDPNKPYINRRNRPEWSAVGMMGKLYVRDDGTAQVNSYVTAKDGIATHSDSKTNMRVMKRVTDNIILVCLK